MIVPSDKRNMLIDLLGVSRYRKLSDTEINSLKIALSSLLPASKTSYYDELSYDELLEKGFLLIGSDSLENKINLKDEMYANYGIHPDNVTDNVGDIINVMALDIGEDFRIIFNRDILRIMHILHDKGPLSLEEIKEEMNISTNVLNHHITNLKSLNIVISKDRELHLSNYGAAILKGILDLKSVLKDKSKMFNSISDEMIESNLHEVMKK
jgi:hypothetical protein